MNDEHYDDRSTGNPPKNYLVESILVTILCCLPFGIVGIINASKVESAWKAGDYEGADRAAADAKKWTKIGFIIGASVIGLYAIFMIITLIFAASGGM